MNTAENNNGAAPETTPSVPVITVEAPETQKRHSKAYGESSVAAFEPSPHADHEAHHHHTHGEHAHHEHGHHLLQVEHLSVSFRMYEEDEPFFQARRRDVEVIHDLSVSVHEGEVIAVVGASGSGKSLLADAILGLYEPNATVTGRIWFDGEECDATRLEELRGHGISLVPQSTANLDPLMRVGKQVEGLPRNRQDKQRRQARRKELFARYGLAEDVAKMYPHELSGGMTRRVLLCCALMDEPRLIVADEPTPGLDLDLACKALADLLDRPFVDCDREMEKVIGMSVADYITRYGEEAFRAEETAMLTQLGKTSGLVIATGGGCVTRPENYPRLHQNGTMIFLERELSKLPKKGRPLSLRGSLQDMYTIRLPMYRRFADVTVPNDGAPEKVAKAVEEAYERISDQRA